MLRQSRGGPRPHARLAVKHERLVLCRTLKAIHVFKVGVGNVKALHR